MWNFVSNKDFLLLSPAPTSSDFTYSREYKTFSSIVSRLNGQQCPDDSLDFRGMASLTTEQISRNWRKNDVLIKNTPKLQWEPAIGSKCAWYDFQPITT